jgi:bifunctional non-homologous end joining protein LigD
MPDEPDRGDAPAGRLRAYREKRSADRTPEPFGGEDAALSPGDAAAAPAGPAWARPRLFCVQKHAATRLHYDFRLEIGGVLRSWAVPRGPSLDPNEKRMAVEVEDHPVEYADFEGVIPEGNYGAGEVIVWDRGLWVPLEDPTRRCPGESSPSSSAATSCAGRGTSSGRRAGGRRLEGVDARQAGGRLGERRAGPPPGVDLLRAHPRGDPDGRASRAGEARAELERLGAARQEVRAGDVGLMLAETAEKPFTDPAWLFELKYDGFRVLAAREGGRPRLVYRRGSDATAFYPEVARALAALPRRRPRPRRRGGGARRGGPAQLPAPPAPRAAGPDGRRPAVRPRAPATYYAFDLLAFEGFDLRPLPLVERKRLLQSLLPRAGPVRFLDHVEEQGEAFYAEVSRLELEGLIAKRADAPYRPGRSPHWLKLRRREDDDFVVVGFTEPQGGRAGFGALHLAAFSGDALVYCGRAGSGFADEQLVALRAALEAARRTGPACAGPLPAGRGHVWVEPRLVAEVRYLAWTEEGLLRQPVFVSLSDDKPPGECAMPTGRAGPALEEAPEHRGSARRSPPDAAPGGAERKVPFTNLGKVFWPDEGYTKGDLVEYYRAISPWILPYLKDRLLVLTRFPDGMGGKSFFQKDAPGFAPGWVRLERVWSESAQREIDYFVAGDVESLLYIANLGTIPLHVWASRTSDLAHPDWCILDLDPKTAPFLHVVQVARAVRDLAEEIGLPVYVKTSGSTGLHVLVPLGGLLTFEQCRQLGELLARVVAGGFPRSPPPSASPRPGRARLHRLPAERPREAARRPLHRAPVPGARCSAPLLWDEVDETLELRRFTIRTLPERMSVFGRDPLAAGPHREARPPDRPGAAVRPGSG